MIDPVAAGMPFLNRDMLNFEQGTVFTLEVALIANDNNAISIRGLTREGPFTFKIHQAASGNVETFSFGLADVPIAVTVVSDDGSMPLNGCYLTMHLGINGSRSILMMQGNLGQVQGLSWPHAMEATTMQRHGQFVDATVANPAAGVDFSGAVPTNQWWKVRAIVFVLTASATVASRKVNLNIDAGSNPIYLLSTPAAQTASQVITYSFAPTGVNAQDTITAIQQCALPFDLWLPPGSNISSAIGALQAGDQISGIRIFREVFYTPYQ